MTDIVDQQTRSRMMAGIKGRNTRPELALRRALHARGFRYRVHSKEVHGRPDLVLPKRNAVVFVHGCFWHRHEGCRYATTPSTRTKFWRAKFEANAARDEGVREALLTDGWRVAIAWECALKRPELADLAAELLAAWLRSESSEFKIGEADVRACRQRGCIASARQVE